MRSNVLTKNILSLILPVLLVFSLSVFADTKELDDMDITKAVESELQNDDAVAAHLIDVATYDGVVTLSGVVDNLLAKERATDNARIIKGVRSVVNDITVQPVEQTDADIKKQADLALLRDPATESYEISTLVTDGKVALSGTVESWQEKQLAASVVKGIRGVTGIENNIEIQYQNNRSDYEVMNDVKRRLENDVWIDEDKIEVRVKNGKVMLTGLVGSAYEHNLAQSLGWVMGTKSVDTENLLVNWWAEDDLKREEKKTYTDQEIANAISDAFLFDPRVNSFEITVNVENGIADLNGTVDNARAKKAAMRDAKNTIGVWDVENNIRVRPDELLSNKALKDKVEAALLFNPYVELYEIDVSAVNGLVYLDGSVNTPFEREKAEEIASNVQGAVGVINNIDFKQIWEWRSDWQINQNIKDEIRWSPFIDLDEVNIHVEDGIATLTGQVDSWNDRRRAEQNAYEGGAKDVVNNLFVNDWTYHYSPYWYMNTN